MSRHTGKRPLAHRVHTLTPDVVGWVSVDEYGPSSGRGNRFSACFLGFFNVKGAQFDLSRPEKWCTSGAHAKPPEPTLRCARRQPLTF
jgi:hypothetical protein